MLVEYVSKSYEAFTIFTLRLRVSSVARHVSSASRYITYYNKKYRAYIRFLPKK